MGSNLLADFLDRRSLTQAEFAALVGIDQGFVSKLASGAKLPGLATALAIAKATDGAVPAESWVQKPRRKRGRAA